MKKILILISFFIVMGFNLHVNADRVARGLFGGAAGGALLGGLAGGGRGAAIGAGVGAGVGLMAGAAAEERARERRRASNDYVYQAPPAADYVDGSDDDVVYVPVKRRYVAPPRVRRTVTPRTQRIIYRD